jgi:hypothetical protein
MSMKNCLVSHGQASQENWEKRRRFRIDIFAMEVLYDAVSEASYVKAAGPYGVNAKWLGNFTK